MSNYHLSYFSSMQQLWVIAVLFFKSRFHNPSCCHLGKLLWMTLWMQFVSDSYFKFPSSWTQQYGAFFSFLFFTCSTFSNLLKLSPWAKAQQVKKQTQTLLWSLQQGKLFVPPPPPARLLALSHHRSDRQKVHTCGVQMTGSRRLSSPSVRGNKIK